MSHCRWVVVAEDCFDQLRQLKSTTSSIGTLTSETTESQQPEPLETVEDPVKPVTDPVEPSTGTVEPSSLKVPVETVAPKETVEPVEPEEPAEQGRKAWIAELPPSYQQIGSKLIEDLVQAGLEISNKGIISVDGTPIEDYSIISFLRTVSVPFNQGTIPLALQEWLRIKGITKFRNHLATIRPQWIKRYSWRESTMANRRGRFEDQKPSSSKHKG